MVAWVKGENIATPRFHRSFDLGARGTVQRDPTQLGYASCESGFSMWDGGMDERDG